MRSSSDIAMRGSELTDPSPPRRLQSATVVSGRLRTQHVVHLAGTDFQPLVEVRVVRTDGAEAHSVTSVLASPACQTGGGSAVCGRYRRRVHRRRHASRLGGYRIARLPVGQFALLEYARLGQPSKQRREGSAADARGRGQFAGRHPWSLSHDREHRCPVSPARCLRPSRLRRGRSGRGSSPTRVWLAGPRLRCRG
jgi:hypothetical protein